MNLRALAETVIAECEHCGLPIRALDIEYDGRYGDFRLGGEHDTCGADREVTTPEQRRRMVEHWAREDVFADAFKAAYCKGEP